MKKFNSKSNVMPYGINTKKHMTLDSKRMIIGMLLLLPALASLLVFKYLPMIMGAFISFFDFDIVNMPGEFIGFDNYIRVFKDPRFYSALGHNFKMLCYVLVMNFWVPIILAILINEINKGKTAFRLAYFIPGCAPVIAMNIIWKYFWQPDYGVANYLVGLFGIEPQLWLNDTSLVYFCMHFPGLIICGGMNLVIYLSALQNIPQELYEASVIDGASVMQRIRKVTLPQISDTVFLLFTLTLINVVNAMENVMVLTGGGPAGSTETVLLYAYKQATNSMDYSYAITMITIAFIIVLIINTITDRLKNRGA